jgi:hypothetical protein
MRIRTSRAALGSVAVALLTVALLAPTAMAGNGNGNGNGNGASQGQGHGKPAGVGRSGAPGQQKKAENQAKHEKKAKKEKKAKEAKAREAKATSLAKAACKNGGWQTLQTADGTPFTNQGRCVSYAVHGGVLEPLAAEEEPVVPADEPADAPKQGGLNFLASLPCKDGGWQAQQRADGTRFDNQGHCVSYAVRGGVLAAVVPVVTISFAPSIEGTGSCDATATLGDFDLSTDYVGLLTVDGAIPPTEVAITTDVLGDASVALGAFAPDAILSLTVDEVTSGDTIVACPVEVEAP